MRRAYGWVHAAAHLLANHSALDAAGVRRRYRGLLGAMARWQSATPTLARAIRHFLAVTQSHWRGLFHCYDCYDCYDDVRLPRTNNALEQYFATARYRERRATGRRGASPGLVVRGSARVVACVATPPGGLPAAALVPADLTAWRALRATLEARHESRRAHLRFRRAPDAYLAALERQLLQPALPT